MVVMTGIVKKGLPAVRARRRTTTVGCRCRKGWRRSEERMGIMYLDAAAAVVVEGNVSDAGEVRWNAADETAGNAWDCGRMRG